jgi:hypothetical protein
VTIEKALAHAAESLRVLERGFALVGGLAVSLRAEVRFTRDVDLAVTVEDDADFEHLIFDLSGHGYATLATVEQQATQRLATVRLRSPLGFVVDLLGASSGIEARIVERATVLSFGPALQIPVARAEELLATKILSMTEHRLQDRLDARNLLLFVPELDVGAVRDDLELITARGYHRGQDLPAKLAAVIDDVKH